MYIPNNGVNHPKLLDHVLRGNGLRIMYTYPKNGNVKSTLFRFKFKLKM